MAHKNGRWYRHVKSQEGALMKYTQATGGVYQGGRKPESGLFLSIICMFI